MIMPLSGVLHISTHCRWSLPSLKLSLQSLDFLLRMVCHEEALASKQCFGTCFLHSGN
eukprot:UN14909